MRLVFDSDLNRETMPEAEARLNRPMRHNIRLCWEKSHMPTTVVKDFDLIYTLADGRQVTEEIRGNHQRLVRVACGQAVRSVRVVLRETWGSSDCRMFAFDRFEAAENASFGQRPEGAFFVIKEEWEDCERENQPVSSGDQRERLVFCRLIVQEAEGDFILGIGSNFRGGFLLVLLDSGRGFDNRLKGACACNAAAGAAHAFQQVAVVLSGLCHSEHLAALVEPLCGF